MVVADEHEVVLNLLVTRKATVFYRLTRYLDNGVDVVQSKITKRNGFGTA
jgi:hypothetical protein